MLDCSIGSPACQAVKEAGPRMPSRAAARVFGLVYNATNCLQRLNLFRVLTKREFYLSLFQHGVNSAKLVGFGVRHRVEAVERVAEVRASAPLLAQRRWDFSPASIA